MGLSHLRRALARGLMLTVLLQAILSLAGCPSDYLPFLYTSQTSGAELCTVGGSQAASSQNEDGEGSLPGGPHHAPCGHCPACLSLGCHGGAIIEQPEQVVLPSPERLEFSVDDAQPLLAQRPHNAHNRDPPRFHA
jgi:hypothetical protein